MKLDKKQVPQLIVLGILVVAFVGFLSFNVMSTKKHAAKHPAAAKAGNSVVAQSSEDKDEAQAKALVTMEDAPTGVFPDLASVPARRDPFVPQKMPGAELENPTTRPAVRPIRNTEVARNPMGRVPPFDLGPVNPFNQRNAAMTLAANIQDQEKDPQFTLTGVVRGESNVAIIRAADNERHVVRQGQFIDGRYKVLTVTDDEVILAYKDRRIPVKLGGANNAK